MGSWPRNRARASTRLGRWDSMDNRRYAPTIEVQDVHVMTLQFTVFGLWKRIDWRLHPVRRSCNTSPMPRCVPTLLAGWAGKQTMTYPIQFRPYPAMKIFYEVRTMRLKHHSYTAYTVCALPNTLPLRMLSALMMNPGGSGVRWRSSGSTEWSRSATCWIVRVKEIFILLLSLNLVWWRQK